MLASNLMRDNPTDKVVNQLAVICQFFIYDFGANARKTLLHVYIIPLSYITLLFHTYLIRDSRCLPILTIALFSFILLRYSLYFINIAGSFRINIQLLSIIASRKYSLHLRVMPLTLVLSFVLLISGTNPA